MKHADFESVLHDLYGTATMHETLTYPLWNAWANTRNYWHTLLRARVAWVRNWQAVPMIVDSKPKWILTYERRRLLRWVPVQVAIVDSLDECFALVKHRRQSPMNFAMSAEGNVTGSTTWSFNIKVNADASDELRPKGSDHGATAASSASEVRAQAAEETQHGQAEGGHTPEDPRAPNPDAGSAEEATGEAPRAGASVLGRQPR